MIELGRKQRPAVLYVDDEAKALQYFREAFEDDFTIYTANNALEGYAFLMERGLEIGVLITDQRMPGEKGVDLLEKARRLNPNLVRILVTAYTDYDTAVEAVNSGRIYRYIHKPWDPEEMQTTLERATDLYTALVERERLLVEKLDTVRHVIMSDKVSGLGILAEGLNHHMRNALTVVRAFVDLAPLKVREELHGGEPMDNGFWSELHVQAQDQMQRIQTVLNRLGEASQFRDFPREDIVHPLEILDDTASLYLQSFDLKGIRLTYYVHPNVPQLRVNAERFSRLWRLLLSDQLTHLTQGDQVHIHAEPWTDSQNRSAVCFTVQDTGAWADKDNVGNLFDPFFVRTHQPTEIGVNLTACYVIVHQHGGNIEASPREGGGLNIKITFPADTSGPAPDADAYFQRLLDHERRWKDRES